MKRKIAGFALAVLMASGMAGISWKAVEVPQTQEEALKKISEDSLYQTYLSDLYHSIHLDSAGLNEAVFDKAITGYYNLKSGGYLREKSILTIADFDQESCKKRLYIIDLNRKELLLNTWVAHGQNSGGDKPDSFSNRVNSNQSSLGFYLTGETYYGKHGRSLKLDGMDAGFNDRARERAIVVHGADYVGQETIDQLGRLGRSQGCPAVASRLANSVINIISDKTVLFINKSDQFYASQFLNVQLAAETVLKTAAVLASKD